MTARNTCKKKLGNKGEKGTTLFVTLQH